MILGLMLWRLDRLDEARATIQRGRRAAESLGWAMRCRSSTTGPGEMVLARIPCGPPSMARWRVMPMTPALAAEWASPGSGAYRKLGVRSRAQLARQFGRD